MTSSVTIPGELIMSMMNLEDCVRALKDRPSMERELADLREFKRKFEVGEQEIVSDLEKWRGDALGWQHKATDQERELQELKAALEEREQRAKNAEVLNGSIVELYKKACADCQRYEAALKEIAEPGHVYRGATTLEGVAANALKGEGEGNETKKA